MSNVNRDTRFDSDIVDKLCPKKANEDHNKVFGTIKELMVFAALVGVEENEWHPIPTGANTISVSLETFASTNHDTYIFLTALHKGNDATLLKDENLHEAIKIFEGYCNAGFLIIRKWSENSDLSIDEIIFNKSLEIHNQH